MARTRNIIPDFTKPEIDYIIENANFTEQELQFLICEIKNIPTNYVPRK